MLSCPGFPSILSSHLTQLRSWSKMVSLFKIEKLELFYIAESISSTAGFSPEAWEERWGEWKPAERQQAKLMPARGGGRNGRNGGHFSILASWPASFLIILCPSAIPYHHPGIWTTDMEVWVLFPQEMLVSWRQQCQVKSFPSIIVINMMSIVLLSLPFSPPEWTWISFSRPKWAMEPLNPICHAEVACLHILLCAHSAHFHKSFSFTLKKKLCACIFCLHVCSCTMYTYILWRPEESAGSPGAGDFCELYFGC